MLELIPLFMFLVVCLVLMAGFPVAFTLAGTALLFAFGGLYFGVFEGVMLRALPNRLFGIINNETLIAVPLFVFMGSMLERARVAEDMLQSMASLFGGIRGGLAYSVILVGMLLAASTGIVGATVVTMGLLSLPVMMKNGYDKPLSTGIICASGTLGQIIPPSIVLILLGDVLSSAYLQAQSAAGVYPPKAISVGDLFMGALLPGLVLVVLYLLYVALRIRLKPSLAPAIVRAEDLPKVPITTVLLSLFVPLGLIIAVLGSIIVGLASPSEAAAVGAVGALILAFVRGQLTIKRLREVMLTSTKTTSMVFMILIGASIFSLVFRAYNGDDLISQLFEQLPGGALGAMLVVMLVMFLLGFILDFIEIIYVVVPIVAPVLMMMGLDPIWLGIMIAINLQTSFLTPPFGFALFYLRGVTPPEIATKDIYRGVIPFIGIQLLMLILLAFWPDVTTWLPHLIYGD
ncbi:MAG: TRAP transporter large permease subunit [Gammaproteobacteria bacterium]|nr:TRAP transporter large permease subunit [Gammaproteobacteria bacterium]NNJ72526.1 TRAP transporter large permease subunit [Enterobacterales bacterium]